MPRPLSDWQDEIAAGILEDLEEITGVSIGEMMADEIEALAEVEEEYEVFQATRKNTKFFQSTRNLQSRRNWI